MFRSILARLIIQAANLQLACPLIDINEVTPLAKSCTNLSIQMKHPKHISVHSQAVNVLSSMIIACT